MKTKFEDFVNEYHSPVGYEKVKVDGDNNFLNKIMNADKLNIKETILYRWMVAKSIPFLDFISVVNNIYDLELNFNQDIEESKDPIIQEMKIFWLSFKRESMEYFEYKKGLNKIRRMK